MILKSCAIYFHKTNYNLYNKKKLSKEKEYEVSQKRITYVSISLQYILFTYIYFILKAHNRYTHQFEIVRLIN